jgi:hypothetical protein
MRFLLAVIFLFSAFYAQARTGGASSELIICATNTGKEDFDAEFEDGPITVPSGSVFEFAGQMVGQDLMDPDGHKLLDSKLSPAEKARIDKIITHNNATKVVSAVITMAPIILNKGSPCGETSGQAVLSEKWGWQIAQAVSDMNSYYQIYGVLHRGYFDPHPSSNPQISKMIDYGALNASVIRTTGHPFDLDAWSAAQPPDEDEAEGSGNEECWGDQKRQDITCRSLTDRFLTSLEGATRADVEKAMKVNGIQFGNGALHFLSNYSRGARAGGGDVNFTFDASGRVSAISGAIETADGGNADFIWNAELLPRGCSDFPGSTLQTCKQAISTLSHVLNEQ